MSIAYHYPHRHIHIHIYIYRFVNIHMLANKLLNSWPQLRVAGWQPSVLKQGGKFCWLYPYPPFNGLRILTTILSKISSTGWTNMIIFDFVVYTHFFGYGATYMDPPEWMVTSRNLWVFWYTYLWTPVCDFDRATKSSQPPTESLVRKACWNGSESIDPSNGQGNRVGARKRSHIH